MLGGLRCDLESLDMVIRIGSRESALAVAQAQQVMDWVATAMPDAELALVTFKTKGDVLLEKKISELGDKGLFVKELEMALLAGEIDLAVHSMKDMPADLPDGLVLKSAGPREDARDVMIGRTSAQFEELPAGAVVGTSSLRRIAQLTRRRPDLTYAMVRGNLNTRLKKLENGEYDALILAAAGVHRLGWKDKITQYFDAVTENIPAVGQGILGIEFAANNPLAVQVAKVLCHPTVETVMTAERTVLKALAGGCQTPLGVFASPHPDTPGKFLLTGVVLSVDGADVAEASLTFEASSANGSGKALAQTLLSEGGQAILDRVLQATP